MASGKLRMILRCLPGVLGSGPVSTVPGGPRVYRLPLARLHSKAGPGIDPARHLPEVDSVGLAARRVEQPVDDGQQPPQVQRLGDLVGKAGSACVVEVALHRVGADGHHRDVARAVLRAPPPMVNVPLSGPDHHASSTRPPGRLYLMALDSRFCSTCRSRVASASTPQPSTGGGRRRRPMPRDSTIACASGRQSSASGRSGTGTSCRCSAPVSMRARSST